jgi:hypothetical protein
MNKFILIIGLIISSVSFGSHSPSLKIAIFEQVNPDLSDIELDEFHQDFVVVSFYIKDFQVHIIDAQGSQKQLIQLISNELAEMYIKNQYSTSDVYNYKFTFAKA